MLPVVVIPAYQPEKILINIIEKLKQLSSQQQFIVVDDGSTTIEAKQVFEELSTYSNITLLKHTSNQGKGSALKTAFAYFLENFSEERGVVTADADGQHLPEDIFQIIQSLQKPQELVLGVRIFGQSVPFRSRFGNGTTRKVFEWYSGLSIQDTQTGLRGISRDLIPSLLTIKENGYAFEMSMLVLAVKKRWGVKQIPITTVYIEQNRSSHFNPLLDSLKIYYVFIRYSALGKFFSL
jgi:glycosyltransferase involved in cell wall biosynthesis